MFHLCGFFITVDKILITEITQKIIICGIFGAFLGIFITHFSTKIGDENIIDTVLTYRYNMAKAGDYMKNLPTLCSLKRCSFELFKSNVCHRLKELGDINFIIEILENNIIIEYFNRKWYPESFYLLAMLDYLSRINNIPLCNKYNDLRLHSLSETIYPSSIIAISAVSGSNYSKEKAIKEAIPEFMMFNIVENEVRNII